MSAKIPGVTWRFFRVHVWDEPDWRMKLFGLIRMIPAGRFKDYLLDRWCDLSQRK